jgi:aminopeptidase N
MQKTLFVASVFILTHFISFSQIRERDKIDVKNYSVNLTIPDTENAFISGNTEIKLVFKKDNTTDFSLDLADLIIDSLFLNSVSLKNFIRRKENVEIPLNKAMMKNDSVKINIFYHGKPVTDPAWGGFYFTDNTAFNMGVGMKSDPQVFGRCWFACNDTLTDKATYQFRISVKNNLTAVCSGVLDSVKIGESGFSTYFWSQKLPISTYMASVSVGNYKLIESLYSGTEKKIPIQWYVKSNRKEAAKKSFIHINEAIETFEKYYGAYSWEKVGFVSVPFNSGAMEHAENISYPDYAVDGTLKNEHLWAHELSHSWFGNLATCQKPEDMWLNEGWASFSEALFMQSVYGEKSYRDYIRNNHKNVLTKTHLYDNGYRAVYGNTKDYTYGSTVYEKGADVIHCLRDYLGDSLFFAAVHEYLKKYAFSNASTEDLKNVFSEISKKDLSDFFENWIYKPGFPHFEAEIQSCEKKGNDFLITTIVNQKFIGRNFYSKGNIAELTFYNSDLNSFTVKAEISGKSTIVTAKVPFKPVCVLFDKDEKISDATIDNYSELSKQTLTEFPDVDFKCNVSDFKGKALIQATLNIIPAENIKLESYNFSSVCYWSIYGYAENLKADGIFTVDKAFQGFTCSSNQLRIFYRSSSKSAWRPVVYSVSELNSNIMEIIVPNFKLGEYVVAEKK